MTPKEMLEAAWELIKDPHDRCTGVLARNIYKRAVEPGDCDAVCFCSIGALDAIDEKIHGEYAYKNKTRLDALNHLKQAGKELFNCRDVGEINDSDVINNPPRLYARAIEIADGKF